MSSPINDVRKLKANSAATASELIDWLAKMRGKAPREVLGAVASSHLFAGFIQAAFLLGAVIALWTAGAWGWETYVVDQRNVAGAEAKVEKPAAEPSERKVPDNVANPEKAKMPDLGIDDKQKVADKLGIGETKEAPANFNPLDNAADDLLKGLE